MCLVRIFLQDIETHILQNVEREHIKLLSKRVESVNTCHVSSSSVDTCHSEPCETLGEYNDSLRENIVVCTPGELSAVNCPDKGVLLLTGETGERAIVAIISLQHTSCDEEGVDKFETVIFTLRPFDQ